AVELLPFPAAVTAGVPMVMTTHILFPTLDAERPATLSRPILTGLLRGAMRPQGLIITDRLQPEASAHRSAPRPARVLALAPGRERGRGRRGAARHRARAGAERARPAGAGRNDGGYGGCGRDRGRRVCR